MRTPVGDTGIRTESMTLATETTELDVTLGPRGAQVRAGGGALRVLTQSCGGARVRVAVVPERALLLAGDDVVFRVHVGEGVQLHLQDIAGTIAHDMRGGQARWRFEVDIAADGCLLHEALPWVSAQGSCVERDLILDLAPSAAALLRETIVLGRHGEGPGQLVSRTRVARDGIPVLVEDLHAADLAPARVLDAVYAFGVESPPAPGATRLVTAGGEVIHRVLGDAAHHACAVLDQVWRQTLSEVPNTS